MHDRASVKQARPLHSPYPHSCEALASMSLRAISNVCAPALAPSLHSSSRCPALLPRQKIEATTLTLSKPSFSSSSAKIEMTKAPSLSPSTTCLHSWANALSHRYPRRGAISVITTASTPLERTLIGIRWTPRGRRRLRSIRATWVLGGRAKGGQQDGCGVDYAMERQNTEGMHADTRGGQGGEVVGDYEASRFVSVFFLSSS